MTSHRVAESGDSVVASLARRAAATPDAPVVCLYDAAGEVASVLTYGRLAGAAENAAKRLADRLDPDETVLLQATSGPDLVVWTCAGLLAGVRVCMLHPSWTMHEVLRVASRTGARAVIGDQRVEGLEHMALASVQHSGSHPEAGRSRRAPGSIVLQSSGTTGEPKLARRGEASLDADARGVISAAGLTADDRILFIVPMSHSYGVDLLVAAILAGASMHVFERFELAGVDRLLRRGEVSVLPGVPFMFEALSRVTAGACGLRLAFSAGSILPAQVSADLHASWGMRIGQLYGATELGSVTLGRPDEPGFDPRSVGRPMPGVSVRIVDPVDPARPCTDGAEGELAVRAPSMLDEYIDGPVPLADGHFLTGDLGRIDTAGRVFVTGRLKHLIDVGGLKVNPLEVEETMALHPAIAECALVPLPLSETVTRLRLLYVARLGVGVSSEELRAFARERLSPHKLPRIFEPVAALPRSSTGKLLRHLLGRA